VSAAGIWPRVPCDPRILVAPITCSCSQAYLIAGRVLLLLPVRLLAIAYGGTRLLTRISQRLAMIERNVLFLGVGAKTLSYGVSCSESLTALFIRLALSIFSILLRHLPDQGSEPTRNRKELLLSHARLQALKNWFITCCVYVYSAPSAHSC